MGRVAELGSLGHIEHHEQIRQVSDLSDAEFGRDAYQPRKAKGSPLTEAEVIEIRDGCPSVAVPIDIVEKIDAERGYKDIDPERCWEQWQKARKSLI